MLEFRAVTKTFGLKPVLRGIDLAIAPGEFLALVGPNGAGKTTLLRIAATLSRPTLGMVRVGGYHLPAQADIARQMIGVLSHHPLLYGDLTAEENLQFYGRLYGLPAGTLKTRIAHTLDQVGLAKRGRDFVRTFSRGMAQRLAIARAILHAPPVLLFDEPHTGLDQDASAMLDSVLRSVVSQSQTPHTVLMISHDLTRALSLAHRIAILSRGKLVFQSPTAGLSPAEFASTYGELTSD